MLSPRFFTLISNHGRFGCTMYISFDKFYQGSTAVLMDFKRTTSGQYPLFLVLRLLMCVQHSDLVICCFVFSSSNSEFPVFLFSFSVVIVDAQSVTASFNPSPGLSEPKLLLPKTSNKVAFPPSTKLSRQQGQRQSQQQGQ